MKLSSLLNYNEIVIQMHDNPDADAVASGYALYRYFQAQNKQVRLIYGGVTKISKSNLLMMIREMKIPVEHVTRLSSPELLITVDCQYDEGNVMHFDAHHIAMIDHHNTGKTSDNMAEIRSNIVSCSTIIYDMLKQEQFAVNSDIHIATALYYGLFMDSNELSEIRHPLEREMLESLRVDRALLNHLTHSNFTLEELETAAVAMLRYSYDEKKRLSIIRSKPCDPNILGLVGDLLLQVDSVDVCIIFNECNGGYKLSVRSCVPDIAANEMAEYLTIDIGNGGGHIHKAGGFINKRLFSLKYDDMNIEAYLFSRVESYYDIYDIIYAKDGISEPSEYTQYRKKPYICGYVKTSDVFAEGTECKVHTHQGDVFIEASEDKYLMIGYYGDVYPIEKQTFDRKYNRLEKPFAKQFDYLPYVSNFKNGKVCNILPYARQCVRKEGARICAKMLHKPAKVFTKWNYETYMYGRQGDYICYTCGDEQDIYIVRQEVFFDIYESVLS